ncbi:DUF4085 family protein [Cohnella thailandensis]|uniref:DUF4085 family protein n=2 Tax=Cohnella thailandensis TaxID=557557 RepID=A0A841SVS7_9BACL|nr:DUF4085 family protein [Cohnella thailandensis]
MKYFTKEWYRESQVYGFLVFHETMEDWEEDITWHTREGLDFEERQRNDLERRKPDLLEFLPESFHPYIEDASIRLQYPTPELREMAAIWREDYSTRSKRLWEERRTSYQAIRGFLPDSAVQLYEKSLHDARVLSVERPSESELVLSLDCGGCMHYYTEVKLTFIGGSPPFPDIPVGGFWLYEEIDKTDDGFELRVLFDFPLTEATIRARDVRIEVSAENDAI